MKASLLAGLLLAAGVASANPLHEQLQTCASMKDNETRLRCYDTLSGGLEDQAQQDFGRERQRISEEAPRSIAATIAGIQPGAYDKLTVTLDNGQVWRQTDSVHVNWKSGEQVVLERGAFGSFFMKKASGGRGIRVKRLQ